MKDAHIFFQKFKDGIVGGLNTCAIATVQSFDASAMKADITIEPDGDLVKAVPVAAIRSGGFFIRAPLAKGDMVVVVFSHREIDSIMHGSERKTGRMLSIDDAIIVSGIEPFDVTLPSDNGTDLVIGKQDMSAKLIIGADGKITIDAPAGVTIRGATTTTDF